MKSIIVPVSAVDQVWPLINERINACLREQHGDCSAGDLLTICRSGAGYLMIHADETRVKAAAIWRFEMWLDGPVFRNLITVGEDMEEWLPSFLDLARETARSGGAKHFIADGRKGWGRIFPNAEIIRVTYRLEV